MGIQQLSVLSAAVRLGREFTTADLVRESGASPDVVRKTFQRCESYFKMVPKKGDASSSGAAKVRSLTDVGREAIERDLAEAREAFTPEPAWPEEIEGDPAAVLAVERVLFDLIPRCSGQMRDILFEEIHSHLEFGLRQAKRAADTANAIRLGTLGRTFGSVEAMHKAAELLIARLTGRREAIRVITEALLNKEGAARFLKQRELIGSHAVFEHLATARMDAPKEADEVARRLLDLDREPGWCIALGFNDGILTESERILLETQLAQRVVVPIRPSSQRIGYAEQIALMAHLMRRAGFGAGRDELEERVKKGYEATVEELLHPETQPPVDSYGLVRYQPASLLPGGQPPMGNVNWMYYLVNTKRPLEEKMALFWHHVFATGNSKVDNYDQLLEQINLFREYGMGNYRDLLLMLAKSPTMIFWLDNQQNHGTAVNENWGRELLELFSLGTGNYTETDVRECSRAFTGWTFETKIPGAPYGRFPWKFEYRPEDHDDGEKVFLGHKGRFNGEDIIDIIVDQPACRRFIARHLYSFFVADEPQVPAWRIEPPRDQKAIDTIVEAFRHSKFDMRSTLRVLFNSDFFKNARFQHMKSPAEVVVSTLRLVGGHELPKPGYGELLMQPTYMGQDLLNPPSVEGWHTGREWINSGSLMARINFVAEKVGDTSLPGVRAIIDRVKQQGSLSPEQLVDRCLDLIGPVEVGADTKQELTSQAKEWGQISWDSGNDAQVADQRVAQMLQLIAATREYQFG